MDAMNEQKVRERAYALWEKEGAPHGRELEFWERARQLVETADEPDVATPLQQRTADDRAEDKALESTFPASDPPAFASAGRKKKVKAG